MTDFPDMAESFTLTGEEGSGAVLVDGKPFPWPIGTQVSVEAAVGDVSLVTITLLVDGPVHLEPPK